MAIIYSYPKVTSPLATDVLVLTDTTLTAGKRKNKTKSLAMSDLAAYVVSSTSGITGGGTFNTIPLWTPTGVKIGDSIITQAASGQGVTVTGQLDVTQDFNVTGSTELFSTLEVQGASTFSNVSFQGVVFDGGANPGTAGQVLSSTGAGGDTEWIDAASGTVTGTGTADTISVFKTSSEIYTPVNTTIIAGKSFIQKIDQTAATIELGASTSFAGVNEGLKIYPNTTHFTTRVTPWLEVFAYEDPSLNPLNTYNAAYDGSALIVGKSNTVGDANSSNLAIIGFNNTLKGDKMMVIGQTNVIDGVSNSSSLVVGVSNITSSTQYLKNSVVIGQSNDVRGTTNKSLINGGSNFIFASDSSFVNGSSNQLHPQTKNITISGQANLVYGSNNSTIICGNNNRIGDTNTTNLNNNNFVAGESNSLARSFVNLVTKNSFAIGRGNAVDGQTSGAIGGSNIVFGTTAGNSIAIGNANNIGDSTAPVRNAIAIGTANNVDSDYTIHIGRGLDEVATGGGEYVMVGRNNDQNNDYDLSSIDCSFIVGASDQGAANSRRNAIVVQNKTTGSNESNVILPGVGKYRNYATEAAAIAGGVPLYGLYRSGNDLKINFNETAGGGNEGLTILTPHFQIATPGGSATYTQLNNIVDFDWSGGSGTYEYILPSATAIPYRTIRFVNNSTITASDKIHITAPGTETIDGGSFYEINKAYNGCAVWSDGSQWIVIQAKA